MSETSIVDDPDVHPTGWEPPSRGKGSTNGDLLTAAEKGRKHPGHWVNVGSPRELSKPPHNWVSEVRLGQKAELQRPGETWEASFTMSGDPDDFAEHGHRPRRTYQKMIRLVTDEVSGASRRPAR